MNTTTSISAAECCSESSIAPSLEAAVEHLKLMQSHRQAAQTERSYSPLSESQTSYVVLFRLASLEIVAHRFGPDGLHELRTAIYNILMQNMQSNDRIYDVADAAKDSLLAVCDRRSHPIRQEQLTAELSRVLARNRDFPIRVGERRIMLRIPITLTILPAAQLGDPAKLREVLQGTGTFQPPHTRSVSELPDHAVVPGEVPATTDKETGV